MFTKSQIEALRAAELIAKGVDVAEAVRLAK